MDDVSAYEESEKLAHAAEAAGVDADAFLPMIDMAPLSRGC